MGIAALTARPSWLALARLQVRRVHPVYYLILATQVLPFVYAYFFLGVLDLGDLEQRHLLFIAICTVANFVCGMSAMRASGRLSRRIESAIVAALLVHSGALVVVMGFRLYYSRPMLLSAFLASIFIVICVLMVRERFRTRRIGIIPHKFNPELMSWVGPGASIIPSPEISPRTYDMVLLSFDDALDAKWTRFISNALLSGCEVRHLAEVVEDMRGRVSPDHFLPEHAGANPAFSSYLRLKRILDIVGVVLLLPLAAIVAAIAAVRIKQTMGGKIVFDQQRVGLGGRPFTIYKLRTMRDRLPGEDVGATLVGDPRITPLGQTLRRYRIDELPQLWNVLKGDMSLIGPRPEQVKLSQEYAQALPAFEYRHLLRPGITGWAQVSAGYAANEAETREKLSFDLYYTKYVSPRLDAKIAVMTLFVLFGSQQVR
jgi:lipopolysaccharide/colanic/teichoic acid biosynthesis glycosyltransferase